MFDIFGEFDSAEEINDSADGLFNEGEGINKKDIKHIFDRFYKAKKSSENSIGIGLSLAKTIIEQENGYIKVDSETGKGTTFEIKYLK